MASIQSPHIVILGGGFAGASAAREFVRLLKREEDARITLIDRHAYQLFTPMLTEVAGGQIEPGHTLSEIRRLSPRITFAQGRVDSIGLEDRSVTFTSGDPDEGTVGAQRVVHADHLILALGAVNNFFNLRGVAEHALTITSVGDAVAIHNRALALLEAASTEPDRARQEAMLTFVVGGGGFSGVETMAALNDLVRDAASHYLSLRKVPIRTVLIETGKRLLPELSGNLARYAQLQLERRGVEVLLTTEITDAGAEHIALKDGRRITAHMLIWAAGVTSSPLITSLGLPLGTRGGLKVDGTMAVPDHPGVWALGDCADVPKKSGKGSYGPTAQNATREGIVVARNIVATLHGEQRRNFDYRPIGELAIVGKRAGVASIYGRQFSGMSAWAMWRLVYLVKMPLPSKRLRIAMDWLLDLLIGREVVPLSLSRSASTQAGVVPEDISPQR